MCVRVCRPGVRGGQAPDPFHLDLVRYHHMYRDDLEVCRQYSDIIYSLVTVVIWYIVHGVCVCVCMCVCVCVCVCFASL